MFPNVRRFIGYFGPVRNRILVAQFFLLLGQVFLLMQRSLVGPLVNIGASSDSSNRIIDAALLMIVFSILSSAFYILNAISSVQVSELAAHRLRSLIFAKVQSLSFGNVDRLRPGDLLVRLTVDINNVKFGLLNAQLILLQAPFTLIITLVLVWVTVPQFLGLTVVVLLVCALVLVAILSGMQTLYSRRQQATDAMNVVLQENLAGVRVVKAFVRESTEKAKFAAASETLRGAAAAPALRLSIFMPAMYLLLYMAVGISLALGGQAALTDGSITIGAVVTYVLYLISAIVPLVLLAFLVPYIQSAESSLERLFKVADQTAEVQDKPGVKPVDPASIRGRVAFENVSFSYRDEQGKAVGQVLQGISFVAEPGQTIGFLGATGSGKSSLVNLIPRFYDVTGGRITIDGVDVRDFPQAQLRSLVGIALQRAILFSGTVVENLQMASADDGREPLIEAARAADADGFVSAIPEQYDARVARRGQNFSGGQRQRLSIARALAGRPKILILDDSTSAVDLATEARIQDAVQTMMRETTKFYVAQRISTVMAADQIIVLENGRQVAIGTHHELLTTSALYREIYESQIGQIDAAEEGLS